MARHMPQVGLDLIRITEERDALIALLQDAYAIIESDDPDCEAWLGQARAALAKRLSPR